MFRLKHVYRADEPAGGSAAAPAPSGPTAAPAEPVAAPVAAPAAPAAPVATEPAEKPGYWPADWRQTVSKEDEKVLSRLNRYASPEDAMKALIAAQNRISAGELKPALSKDATPEEKAAWREAHGIPAAPDKYDFGKDFKADVDPKSMAALLKHAHDTDQTPEQVKATLKAWNEIKQSAQADMVERDIDLQTKAEDALRAEWGPEFRRNINLIHGMLDGSTSPALKEKLLGGRLSDGTPIGSSPEALKFLINMALIQNPTGVVVPGSEANPLQGVEEEITKIENTMRTNRRAYNADEKMQARYRELLGAKETLGPRKR